MSNFDPARTDEDRATTRINQLDDRQRSLGAAATTFLIVSLALFWGCLAIEGRANVFFWIGSGVCLLLALVALMASIWARLTRDVLMRRR